MINQTMKMNQQVASRQRGVTLVGLIAGAIVLVFGAILLMKVLPAYIDNRDIANILHTIAHDPDMQNADPNDIRNSFSKRASINNISVVNSQDLVINKSPDNQLVVSVKYHVKIGLVGNLSLWIDFDTSSASL